MSLRIRVYQASDWPALLPIVRETLMAGDTIPLAPDSSDADIHNAWIEVPGATFVACGEGGELLGTYYIKPNQPGLGSHVCNCGYIVSPAARGRGVASSMCEHSQDRAREMGFRAMQFNLVVSTNERAVGLWHRLGFTDVGRLSGAFHHQKLGFVDAFVMYKRLVT
jgi:ribosomal protein S18 acetylase RimI-like enzyme